jgi:hypothetical protein
MSDSLIDPSAPWAAWAKRSVAQNAELAGWGGSGGPGGWHGPGGWRGPGWGGQGWGGPPPLCPFGICI